MDKKCSNCGGNNVEDAIFCNFCGEQLNSSKKGKISNKKIVGIFGFTIILLILITIIISSHNTHNVAYNISTKNILTYKLDSFSFNYPDTFVNSEPPTSYMSNNTDWKDSGFLADKYSNVYIIIEKNPTPKGYTAHDYILSDQSFDQQNGGTTSSLTDKTNSNGVQVSEDIANFANHQNTITTYYTMIFADNSGIIYSIKIYGGNVYNSEMQQVANTIFNSLKLN